MRDIYDIETSDDAIDAYIDKFGGFPYFLFMGATEQTVIDAVVTALELDRKIEPVRKDVIY